MVFNYTERDYESNKDWMAGKLTETKSIQRIAVEAVLHDLNNEYCKNNDGEPSDFEHDAESTYWCGDCFYSVDEVFRVYINEKWYVFKCVYVTKGHNIILVVCKPKDIWAENSFVEDEMETLENIYFLVEY